MVPFGHHDAAEHPHATWAGAQRGDLRTSEPSSAIYVKKGTVVNLRRGKEPAVNAIIMGCLAPEKWWADRRAKHRTVILVIVLSFYGWLLAATQMTPLEAAGILLGVGLAAGIVAERFVDGTRPSARDFLMMRQVLNAEAGQP